MGGPWLEGTDSFGLLAWGPIMWGPIILLAWPCMMFFTMLGYFTATFARCLLVSFWFSCQQMMVG